MRNVARYISSFLIFVLCIGIISLGFDTVYAQPSYTMNYQGKLTDNTGLAVADGTYAIAFNLYTQSSGGVAVWTETRNGVNEVTVRNGLFSVMLGSVTSLSSVNFNQPLYLGVTVEADAEMTPRKPLGTVPSAFEAKQLGGVASTSFLRSDQADVASSLLTFSGGLISNSSSTLARLSFTNATGTSLFIGGDRITDFVGDGLQLSGGTLQTALGSSIQAGEIANGDHGFFSYASGVASLDTGGLTSTNLSDALTDETGTGRAVFSASPTFTLGGGNDGQISIGSAGMRLTTDADGAITFLGLGDGSDEDLTLNLDDTANTGVFTSSTGLNLLNFSGIGLQESGSNVLSVGDLDTCAEFAALGALETGTCGTVVLSGSPTITTPTFTTSANFGTAGVRLSDDGDGAITFLGLGDGSDESLTLNLDDTADTGVFTSGTGLTTLLFSSITQHIQLYGSASGPAQFIEVARDNVISSGYDATTGQVVSVNRTNIGGTAESILWGQQIYAYAQNTSSGTSTIYGSFIDVAGSGNNQADFSYGQHINVAGPGDVYGVKVDVGSNTGTSYGIYTSSYSTATSTTHGLYSVVSDIYGGDAYAGIFLGGNVGIGTTTPSSALTVSGDLRVTGTFRDSSGDAGTNGQVLLSTLTGTNWVATSSLGFAAGFSAANIDTSAELAAIVTDETGSGALVFSTSPTLTTPNLGTPSALTLTNATGLPISGLSGLGANVGTWLATPSSLNLRSALTDETGTGVAVFNNEPTFVDTGGVGGGTITLGTSGATISTDGDGAISFFGLGDGNDENLTLNLDDTANTGVFTSASGLNIINFSGIGLQESGSNVLSVGDVDTSSELAAILGDETGTGNVVFSASPTFTGTPVLPSSFTIGGNTFARAGAHALTLTNTAPTNVTLPTSGTLYGTAASSITSAQLLSSLSDETGTGVAVFGTSPTFTTSANFGTAGVRISDDGDGAITFLGLGDGFDENLILNFDDVTNTISASSTTGVNTFLFEGITQSVSKFNDYGQYINGYNGIIHTTGYDFQTGAAINAGVSVTGGSYDVKGQEILVSINDSGPGLSQVWGTIIQTGIGENTADITYGEQIIAQSNSGTVYGLFVDAAVYGPGSAYAAIFNTGNVGIGTSTPSQALSIGATSSSQFLVSNLGVVIDGTWQGDVISSAYLDAATILSTEIDSSSELAAIVGDETGTGALVFANSPTLVTPNLGTPSSLTLTNATGLPVATGISGLGSGVATWLATPSSANLSTAITDETGTGALVFAGSPTFTGTVSAAAATLSSTLTLSGSAANIALGSNWLSGDGGDEGVFVDSTGRVGIGTTAPSDTFEVVGDIVSKGTAWTARSAAGNDDSWWGITYGNGLFVAVSYSGDRVMTSPDGTNWTVRSAAGNDDSWVGVTYGNGLFVAVSNTGDRVMTSPDGITWTARSAAGNNDDWQDVTYGNGLFVAVSSSGDRVITSPDGITWTVRSAAGNDDFWKDITYGNGLFVAVGSFGSDRIMTSPDGTNWTARSAAGDNDTWFDITYGNGLFVAVSASGDRVITSPDGTNWTVRSAAGDNDSWYGVTYGNGLFVAVGISGDVVMTSGKLEENRLATNNLYQGGSALFGNAQFGTTTLGTVGSNAQLSIQSSGSQDVLNLFGSTGSRLFTIQNGGNVGIGTSSPSSKLTVAGDLRVTGAFLDTSGDAGISGQVLLSTLTGTNWTATSTLGLGNGSFLGLNDTFNSYNANRIPYSSASALIDSSSFTFDGTRLAVGSVPGVGTVGSGLVVSRNSPSAGLTVASLASFHNRETSTSAGQSTGFSSLMEAAPTGNTARSYYGSASTVFGTPSAERDSGLLFGSVSSVYVGQLNPTGVAGALGQVEIQNALATVPTASGVSGVVVASAGSATQIIGLTSELYVEGATVDQAVGVYIPRNIVTSGSLDSSIGLLMGPQDNGTENWNLYIQGATTDNYIAGNLGLGTTSPSHQLTVGATAGSQFLVSSAGVISDGIWQGDVIADTYISDTLTIGAGSTFANNIITPNSILSTGQTDEYCLTYESTGTTFEWQTCGGGSSLFTDGGANTYLTATGDNLSIGGTGGSARLNVYGNIDIATNNAGLSFMGTRYLYASSTNDSIVFGESAGASFTSDTINNVAIGYQAGQNASNANADNNNMIGYWAGKANSGNGNQIIGFGAGENNTGNNNILMGGFAGRNNTGSSNVFVGNEAGSVNTGSNNFLIGFQTGRYLSGDSNTAMGVQALYGSGGSVYTANNNIAIGYRAGYAASTSADNNILIGSNVADNLTTGNNNIVIGYDIDNVTATADNRLNIGNLLFGTGLDGTGTTLASGNIGIGDNSPEAKLDIYSTQTSGTLIGYALDGLGVSLSGALTGMDLDLSSYLAAGQSVTGYNTTLPTVTNTGAGTHNYRGLTVTGNALTQTTLGGAMTFTGASITNSNLTQTTGTLSADGVSVTTGTNTTGGTQQGFNVIGQGVAAGTLNALNIANITAGAGTENAINIGTGYDNIFNSTPFDIAGTGQTTLNPLTSFTTGTIFSIGASGATTLSGAFTGLNVNLRNNFIATSQTVTAINAQVPNVANTGGGTYNYNVASFGTSGGTLTQSSSAGTNNYRGAYIFTPNITQSAGTVTANGVVVETGTITTGGTQNGINVTAQGVGAGTLNGINIANITAGAGTENAINIGTGYDTIFNSATLDITGAGAITGATGITSSVFYGGSAASSQLILNSTSGSGTTDDIIMGIGTNGATQAFRIDNENNSVMLGENAGATFTSLTTNNVALGFEAGRYASTTNSVSSNYMGYRAGYNNTNTDLNAFGYEAGRNNIGSSVNALGPYAAAFNRGSNINALGFSAAQANSGDFVNALGNFSAYENTGSYVNAIGPSSAYTNSGSYSEFIGFETGATMSAENSVAIGSQALRGGSNLTLFGNQATTTNNTVIGYRAGYNTLTGGDNNILIGYQAADNLTTGNNNIIIGYDIDNVTATADNRLNIGNLIFGTGLDGTGTTLASGNIGIGTSTPNSRFSVVADSATNYAARFFNDGNNANRYGIRVDAGADDASGTTYYLDAYDGDGGQVGYLANVAGTFGVTDISDLRTKTNVTNTEIVDATAVIQGLRVVDFNRRQDPDGPRITGFIAQEVDAIFPSAVTANPRTGYLGVMKDAFIPLLVKGAQEQQVAIAEQGGLLSTLGASLMDTIQSVGDLEAAVTSGLSENYKTNDTSIEAGEIVSLDTNESATIKRAEAGERIFGVVATTPGLVLGQSVSDAKPVALSGRVPVKVNLEGGDINVGDAITLSSEAGIGTKATSTGRVLGTALEATDESGVIEIFVDPATYFGPQTEANLASLFEPIEENENDTLWSRITTLASNFVDGVLSVAGVKTDELCVGSVCVDEETFLQMVESAGGSQVPASNGNGGDLPPDEEPPAPEGGGGEAPPAEEPPAPEPPPAEEPAPSP